MSSSLVLTEAQQNQSQARPTSVAILLKQYSNELPKLLSKNGVKEISDEQMATRAKTELKMLETALRLTLVPALGGPIPSGERSSPEEVAASSRFLQTLPVEKLRDALHHQKQYFNSTNAEGNFRRRHKCSLKKLVSWVEESGWFGSKTSEETNQKKRLPLYQKRLTDLHAMKAVSIGKVRRVEKGIEIVLRDQGSENNPLAPEETLLSEINPYLNSQLNDLFLFLTEKLTNKVREVTALERVNEVCRTLGKLLKQGHRLVDLSLECLVKPVKLKIEFPKGTGEQVIRDLAYQKWRADQEARSEAEQLKKRVEEDLNSRYRLRGFGEVQTKEKITAKARISILEAWVAVTKYTFRDETDTYEFDDFGDIPAIRVLRKIRRQLDKEGKKEKRVVPRALKSVSWEKMLWVVEQVRQEYHHSVDGQGNPLSDKDRAIRLQKFLVLSFLSLIPPLRQRSFRELVVGRTLRKGMVVGEDFIPIDQMENPEQALWHICLAPSDYKTGDTYGYWYGAVGDFLYPDGRCFYKYLELWMETERTHLNPKSNYLFIQETTGKQHTSSSMCQLVRSTVYRLTGVPVTPQCLRSMFVTHLKRLGVTDKELEAIALAMQHSKKMQGEVYNDQKQAEILKVAFERTYRIASAHLEQKPST